MQVVGLQKKQKFESPVLVDSPEKYGHMLYIFNMMPHLKFLSDHKSAKSTLY